MTPLPSPRFRPRWPGSLRPAGGLGVDFFAVPIDQHHGAARDLVPPLEDVEHGVQRGLEVQDA